MAQDRASADDRKIKNFVIAPEKQLRLVFFSVGIGLMFFVGVFGFQLWTFSKLLESIMSFVPESSNIAPMIADSVHWTWGVFAAMSVAFAIILTVITIVVSHRIYGPIFAIRRHIASLTNGDYAHRTHLRPTDEFQEVATDLNSLSTKLGGGTAEEAPEPKI
jgi:HAMP domain-containing protein